MQYTQMATRQAIHSAAIYVKTTDRSGAVRYHQDGHTFEVGGAAKVVLEQLRKAPLHAASHRDLGPIISQLRHQHGVDIVTRYYKHPKTGGRCGIYTLASPVYELPPQPTGKWWEA